MATKSRHNSIFNSELLFIGLIVGICLLLAGFNFSYGFSQDYDAYLIVQLAEVYNNSEIFAQSRTWGFPLFESYIYILLDNFSPNDLLIIPLLFYILSCLIFYQTLNLIGENQKQYNFIFTLLICVNPFFIISGNTLMETSQAMFLAMCGIYFTIRYFKFHTEKYFLFSVLFLALATATRPDYIILSFCVFLSVFYIKKQIELRHIVYGIIYIIITLTPFLFLYDEWKVPINIVNSQNLINKALKVGLGYLALFGIPLWIFITWKIYSSKPKLNKTNTEPKKAISTLFVISLLFYTIRFFMLPDEVEYVLIIYPLALLTLYTGFTFSIKEVYLMILLVFIPNIMQLYFFKRNKSGDLEVNLGITNGAIAQDRDMRLQNEFEVNDLNNTLKPIAKKYYNTDVFIVGPSKKKGDLAFCAFEDLRFYFKGREDPAFYSNFPTQKVIGFPLPKSKGWKQFTYYGKFTLPSERNMEEIISVEPLKTKLLQRK
ncbi:MAG: hypothetical protein H6604_09685 [Flavobacteriales bacterium]|nr:hypothetical protein [Flavobacteriales bacterium]